MKIDFQHLALFVLVVLALVGHVVLTIAHQPVPADLSTVITAGAGALFGITLPARSAGGTDQP